MASMCDSQQSQQNQSQWIDPLGPTSIGRTGRDQYSASGAPQMRSQLFSYLQGYQPQMNQAGSDYASALKYAAANPGWGAAADQANKNISGQYLSGSPELDKAMATNRSMALAGAADQNARTRGMFARNGMGFSTGDVQAEGATAAAANAGAANTNAQTYLQNYLAERGNQNSGAAALASATGTPLNYLGGVAGAYSSPLSAESNLIGGLSTGGQVFDAGSNGRYTPSWGSDVMNGIATGNSVASTVSKF